jgi:RimJ/RimL family protein N-acetyltransferase
MESRSVLYLASDGRGTSAIFWAAAEASLDSMAAGGSTHLGEDMGTEGLALTGTYIRLEPLEHRHIDGLVAAAALDPSLYQWSPVPQGKTEAIRYVDTALAWRNAGSAVPFAIVRTDDGVLLGSTRFWNLEQWSWPQGHTRHGRLLPDACEIGYSWLSRPAIRTSANTEAKMLMLTHAFETWQVLRVCLHTDARNQRSAAALERIGCKFEGVLRAHRMAADYIARDSMRYSIVALEWPDVRRRLSQLLDRV